MFFVVAIYISKMYFVVLKFAIIMYVIFFLFRYFADGLMQTLFYPSFAKLADNEKAKWILNHPNDKWITATIPDEEGTPEINQTPDVQMKEVGSVLEFMQQFGKDTWTSQYSNTKLMTTSSITLLLTRVVMSFGFGPEILIGLGIGAIMQVFNTTTRLGVKSFKWYSGSISEINVKSTVLSTMSLWIVIGAAILNVMLFNFIKTQVDTYALGLWFFGLSSLGLFISQLLGYYTVMSGVRLLSTVSSTPLLMFIVAIYFVGIYLIF
jgi:hypothetical protein